MSQKRHPAEPLVRSLAVTLPAGFPLARHHHAWPQLIFAVHGVITVTTALGAWVVPPLRGVWVAAEQEHELQTTGEVAMRTLYLRPDVSPALDPACCVLNVPPLVRELIAHIASIGALEEGEPTHLRLLGVLVDLLEATPQAPLSVPMPTDPRARRVAEAVMQNPADQRSIEQLARGSGASSRTIERAFREQTGLTVGRWRQQARLLAALRLLSDGVQVTTVAREVGYQSPSAFVAMFRRSLGRPPAQYLDQTETQAG
jgi:AraC-like DNA-binding protein